MQKTLGLLLAGLLCLAQAVQAQDPQAIVEKHCQACHVAGLGGAPKPDDKAAWAPRLAKGDDAMLTTVVSGKGAMPPKGTCASCSEADLAAAITQLTQAAR